MIVLDLTPATLVHHLTREHDTVGALNVIACEDIVAFVHRLALLGNSDLNLIYERHGAEQHRDVVGEGHIDRIAIVCLGNFTIRKAEHARALRDVDIRGKIAERQRMQQGLNRSGILKLRIDIGSRIGVRRSNNRGKQLIPRLTLHPHATILINGDGAVSRIRISSLRIRISLRRRRRIDLNNGGLVLPVLYRFIDTPQHELGADSKKNNERKRDQAVLKNLAGVQGLLWL